LLNLHVLAVAVDIEVQSNTTRVTQLVDLGGEDAVLWSIARSLALVGLGAWARGGAAGYLPFVGPVAVDIAADAGVTADGLTVLAPQTVGGLGVDKAVRVYDWSDVEVELVDDGFDARIGGVLCEQLPGEVLGGHARDPFSGVHIAVDNDSRP